MKKILLPVFCMAWACVSYAQNLHVNPEALAIRDLQGNKNEFMTSIFVQTLGEKARSPLGWDFYGRAVNADDFSWWTAMTGPSIKIGECKFGVLIGHETSLPHLRGAGWLSLTSKNERWKLFALFEAGASMWWSKGELLYCLSREEHAFELRCGIINHAERIGVCGELEYRKAYLIVAPCTQSFKEDEPPSILIALGARFK